MKKLSIFLCALFAVFCLNAQSHGEKQTVDEVCNKLESFKEYKWGDNERPYEIFIYSVYNVGTVKAEDAAKIEAKALAELKANPSNLRYKMLLAQVLEIVGVQNSANEIADIILQNSADAKNINWTERLFMGLGVSTDKNAKAALLKLTKAPTDFVRVCAVTALGCRGEADAEIAAILKSCMASNFKDVALSNACVMALSKIGSDIALKGIFDSYKKASAPELKQAYGSALFGALSKTKTTKAVETFCLDIYNDKAASKSLKLGAYAELFKIGKAPANAEIDFQILTLDLLKENKQLAIPSSLSLTKMEEPMQTLFVQTLTARGEGYAEIIKLNPKSADLAEAICYAASKMGSSKDYEKLLSFAPLFKSANYNKRDMTKIGYYIASVKGQTKVMEFMKLAKTASPEAQELIGYITECLDSSSSAEKLIAIVKDGDKDAKIVALKTLGNAFAKSDTVFIQICKMYPSFTDAQVVSGAQRLLVSSARVMCTADMFKAAVEQFDASKDPKTKAFFMRFASVYGTEDSAKFLAKAYTGGLKKEAIAEFKKWTNETAFDSLKALEKSDAANKTEIRNTMISIVQNNNLRTSPIIKYISETGTNSREKNLINMIDFPNFAGTDFVSMPNGIKAKATNNNNNLKNAFDGEIRTRWDSGSNREPGMGIMIEFSETQTLKALELLLGSSGGDRVKGPVVYAGESADNFAKIDCEYKQENGKDVFVFKTPLKAKVICIANTQSQGGFWSIHEINFVK